MEALQRVVLSNNWVALIFVLSFVLLFFLKLFQASRLKGFVTSIFNKGFVEIESQEKYIIGSFFDIGFGLFSLLMLSISCYFLLNEYHQNDVFLLIDYLKIFNYILLYISIKNLLEFLLLSLFEVKEKLSYFLISKRSYSYSISVGLLIVNIIYFYSYQNPFFLGSGILFLFSIRLFLILIFNKNLIVRELFYFILYLCAFEIAPLLVLFKLLF